MTDDSNYTKREQDHFLGEWGTRMDKQDKTLERIEAQTIKTNGRVNKLESWRSVIIWASGVLVALSVPIIMLIQSEIRSTVVGVLNSYNIVTVK